ncbi:TRM11 family SAM-dependent methyltransferase [Nonomuraea aurantiaca]|uniref:TRM11 family SAM-dependent methyltransferase n=1 Tax=Nonomuraea aurantiaca TaxID=2878562 RepID=UPI001CD9224F|nr:methyltransferase domain-containing protein [Nonomuraea aurantiaca]MCA2219750.1 methyltransferase domain-containing protein [Nonomuraea aurantiaca]
MHTLAVARAVRGIEPLVAAEIQGAGLGVVRGVRHREVWFETADPGPELLGLRMADDVLLVAAVVEGIGRDREALVRLSRAARELDAESLTKLTHQIGVRDSGVLDGGVLDGGVLDGGPPYAVRGGGVGGPPYAVRGGGVEVSASFVGRRNYSRFDIEDAVGGELARPLGLVYHSRRDGRVPPEGSAAWRVTVEGGQAVIALRVAARPLHRRPYKTVSVSGTLHPPVAAAMAGLARLDRAGTVLDPCCGAGTTLIEARALAPHARLLGFDHDPHAVQVATANATRASAAAIAWSVADAGRIPLPDGSVDRVLVNPPWDRQVAPSGRLRRDPGRLWREIHRVLAVDGTVVALLPEAWRPPGFGVDKSIHLTLAGRHPVVAVLRRSASRGRAG